MPLARLLAPLLVLLLAACFPVAPQVPVGPSYYVMRHLHTPQGETDPGLTPEGQAMARMLPDFFANDPPSAIYVSSYRRTQETAAPLAQALNITPKVYDPRNTPALVQMVKAETGSVLIVGHSNTVPDIVQQLGGTRPADISHNQFGDVWHVSGTNGSTLQLRVGGN